ncbi:D-ribose pyranase [Wukongibacter baidiensis]|uniref:D-ribose pyranase n=1 Tax=Wukongibacter baidiensis TaxID=1723361 RepID=UPI003D7FFEF3
MKKGLLLNSEISYVISKLGHTDGLVIADSGLPIPSGVQRIDLAVTKGIPSFLDVLDAVLDEQRVEEVVIADEIKKASPDMHKSIVERLRKLKEEENIEVKITEVPHEDFKRITMDAKAIIRTGEFTPYANVILKSGVVF